MSFDEKFMRLPQKVRLVLVCIALGVMAVVVLAVLKHVSPGPPTVASNTTSSKALKTAAPEAAPRPAIVAAAPKATAPKKK